MRRDKAFLLHQNISTDFPIAAVMPLAKCLLRGRFIHLFLRYTSIVNLEGFLLHVYLGHLYSYQHTSQYLFRISFITRLFPHHYQFWLLQLLYRYLKQRCCIVPGGTLVNPLERENCCGEEVRGFSDMELIGVPSAVLPNNTTTL